MRDPFTYLQSFFVGRTGLATRQDRETGITLNLHTFAVVYGSVSANMTFFAVLTLFILLWIIHRIITNTVKISGFKPGSNCQKTVLVTGCDSGFGHHLVLKLISEVIVTFAGCLTNNGEELLRKQAIALKREKNLITLRLDITKQETIGDALDIVTRSLSSNQGKRQVAHIHFS